MLLRLHLGGVAQAVGPVPPRLWLRLRLRLVLLVMRRREGARLQREGSGEDELGRRAPVQQPGSLEHKRTAAAPYSTATRPPHAASNCTPSPTESTDSFLLCPPQNPSRRLWFRESNLS